jgi:hypothetical protein
VRTALEPTALAAALRREVQLMDPNLPIYDVQTMEERVANATARTRVTGLLLALFASVALGAVRRDIAALILRYGGVLVGLGVILGLLGALSATRVMRSLLFEIEPTDPVVFAFLTVCTIFVAFAASAAPALRATRVDPLVALKSE